jgi:glycogen synthase
MTPLRILLISNSCPPDYDGGYELRAFQVAQALRERGHQLDLVTSQYRPTFHGKKSDPDWVHRIFKYVLVSQSKSIWRYIDRIPKRIQCTSIGSYNVPALDRFLEDRNYDIAYCFGVQRIGVSVVAPIVQRHIPILWHAGDGYLADHFYHWPKTRLGYAFSLKCLAGKWLKLEKQLDYQNVAFVSEFLRDECRAKGFAPQNSIVISRGYDGVLGWDVERERAKPHLFFMACRIDLHKGIHHAIAAAGRLRQQHPHLDWRLQIAGVSYSGYQAQLEELAIQQGVSDRIEFLGQLPRTAVLSKIREATAFLSCSSYGEPFAGTIIETLANGTTLIGSNAGSILEVVKPDESAFIYEIGDVKRLSEHMSQVLLNPSIREKIALKGVEVIHERYTLDRILDQTENALAQIIENRSRHLTTHNTSQGPAPLMHPEQATP